MITPPQPQAICGGCKRPYQLTAGGQVVRKHFASPFQTDCLDSCSGSLRRPSAKQSWHTHLLSSAAQFQTALLCCGRYSTQVPVWDRFTVDGAVATCPGRPSTV